TIRFMLGSLKDFNPEEHRVDEVNLEEVDKYMLHRLQALIKDVKSSYDQYDFASVSNAIHNYFAVDLSAFYLDFAKDILYVEHADHPRRRSIQTVYHETVVALVKLLSPIIPHTTEEVWEHIAGVEATYAQLTDMPETRVVEGLTKDQCDKWDHFLKVRSDVLK